jgi:hypothetical protein
MLLGALVSMVGWEQHENGEACVSVSGWLSSCWCWWCSFKVRGMVGVAVFTRCCGMCKPMRCVCSIPTG